MRSAFVVLVLGGLGFLGLAASNDDPRDRPADKDSAGGSAQKANDSVLGAWLQTDTQLEISTSEIAVKKSQNPEVKQFASRMIQDHQAMATKLQKYAPASASFSSPRVSAAGTEGAGQALDLMSLKKELAQQCLASAKRELEQLSGADFDRSYVGMQIAKHMEALDTLTVFKKHASADLGKILQEAETTVQGHYDHLKGLMRKLEH
jgi:putative membrane protein